MNRATHILCSVTTVLVLGAFAGCSDDDSEADGRTTPDAGDGSPPGDAAANSKDAEPDASPDAGADAGYRCERERFPLWSAENQGETRATRVPLDVYCRQGGCPRSLREFLEALTCEEFDDAGVDTADGGGDSGNAWLRSEGCGSVQFSTLHPGWPRDFNFDATSGALIGAARLDDIGTEVPGIPCTDAGFVAGEFRASCSSEVLTICTAR